MKNVIDILKERGFFQQCTDEAGLRHRLNQEPRTFYVGVDPTGPSCHIGHIVPLYASAHLQRAGHTPIILMGGGTALIGDPSGKMEMRKMIDQVQITRNIESMKRQLGRIIDFENSNAIVVNNADWLIPLNYIEFLRDIGQHFSVNRMLTFEAYRQRLEKGLSFLEFNYQLLQSYDFLELYRRYNCLLQIGGDDQWGNIVAGMELIRRMERAATFGLTFPLITRSDGAKMGKTEKGALFLDETLTPVYDFFQYWRNVPDDDVERFLLLFTFLDAEECRDLGTASDINASKERLAYEVSQIIHGQQKAVAARDAARSVFSGDGDESGIPATRLTSAQFDEGIGIVDLFVMTGLCPSRSEARRLIQQGGARINRERIDNMETMIASSHIIDGKIILKAGKKRFHRIDVVE
ncbi:MAG: tyrosine--tRNA ligase [spirochete symbiont of Stewartia floridana]|nr:MAG: tyrosine--tRNA ligase [spirochete symbiont of Stewartia floridana]